jgi:hypothetical protein
MRRIGILTLMAAGIGAAVSQPAAAQSQASRNQSTTPDPSAEIAPAPIYPPDEPSGSRAATVLTINGPNPRGWLFPITDISRPGFGSAGNSAIAGKKRTISGTGR